MAHEKVKPTRKQFAGYLKVQKSGVTNMYDVRKVCELADCGLTMENCLYIFTDHNYSDLCDEYGLTMNNVYSQEVF